MTSKKPTAWSGEEAGRDGDAAAQVWSSPRGEALALWAHQPRRPHFASRMHAFRPQDVAGPITCTWRWAMKNVPPSRMVENRSTRDFKACSRDTSEISALDSHASFKGKQEQRQAQRLLCVCDRGGWRKTSFSVRLEAPLPGPCWGWRWRRKYWEQNDEQPGAELLHKVLVNTSWTGT